MRQPCTFNNLAYKLPRWAKKDFDVINSLINTVFRGQQVPRTQAGPADYKPAVCPSGHAPGGPQPASTRLSDLRTQASQVHRRQVTTNYTTLWICQSIKSK